MEFSIAVFTMDDKFRETSSMGREPCIIAPPERPRTYARAIVTSTGGPLFMVW